jgi:hypothetical protein
VTAPGSPEVPAPDIHVDADACPVREEVARVADRLALEVYLVSNGSRPMRPPRSLDVAMVTVEGAATRPTISWQ